MAVQERSNVAHGVRAAHSDNIEGKPDRAWDLLVKKGTPGKEATAEQIP